MTMIRNFDGGVSDSFVTDGDSGSDVDDADDYDGYGNNNGDGDIH